MNLKFTTRWRDIIMILRFSGDPVNQDRHSRICYDSDFLFFTARFR